MENFIFYAVVFRTLSEAMIEIKETSVAKIMLIYCSFKKRDFFQITKGLELC